MNAFRKFTYLIAFLSPLLGETDLISIGGLKIPALSSILFFIAAFVLSRKKDVPFLFTNKLFVTALLYFIIIFLNYAFVLHDLFFKVYEELTPLWIPILRRLVIVFFIFFTFRDEKQAIRLFYFYCAGLAFSSLAAYPEMFILKHQLFSQVSEGNEGYQRAIGFFGNPNDFAFTTVIASIFIYHLYLHTRRKIYFIVTLLLIPPVFLSFSRNGMACLFLAIFLTFNLGKKVRWKTVFSIAFSFIGLCLVIYFIPSIRERVFLLFSGDDSSAIGRLIVMYSAYEKWLTMPFWGIGVYSAPLLMEGLGNSGLLITIHNFYVHALFETGIIGFAVVIWFLATFYKSVRKDFRSQKEHPSVLSVYSKSSLIALLVTFFYIFSGNHIIFEFFWYMIGIQLVIMRSQYKRTKILTPNLQIYA